MKFYVGLHRPSHAIHFDHAFISVNRVYGRKKPFPAREDVILDSGAFTTVLKHGGYPSEPEEYAVEVERLNGVTPLTLAVSQDYMCEAFILEKTGLTIPDHQRLTIERYDRIHAACSVPIMPVLQGYAIQDYLNHIDAYGDRLHPGMRVGVGSVCKRNVSMAQIEDILLAITEAFHGLLLHGFGVKTTALSSAVVWDCLYSADSMAWSFAARKNGGDANDWREAKKFEEKILRGHRQTAFAF